MSKVRVISITNQKGGVGKTTTAINLSAWLANKGKKVLAIDADQQGNTTSGIGLDKNDIESTIYDVMLEECSLSDVKLSTCVKGLEVVPANINLTGAEIELIGKEGREYILKKEIDNIKEQYDFIIIDCPPSLNIITVNALTASDTVLVPIQCEYFALEGLQQLIYTIDLVQKSLNKYLKLEGIVFTMYDARTNLSPEVVEAVKDIVRELKIEVDYYAIIPRNVRLGEAPSHGLPIHLYDPKSKGSESYELLAQQVLERE
ncbi:AAA family ATPase [Clostridium sp. MD294]|uniref:ParA family protein n=1 Tax=Clostridium sp. MD294 TaxID=97138 RepID=UPI0002C9327A|nr:AAA family ATPase [Clostridium sp. MD294]NDO46283.1 ParA family protein [Clostridium sp. MD294]USF29290.1 Sporulation initiation inhibitor protein Soj [Clostridium sp. MD294]